MSERASQAIQAWAQALSQPLEAERFQAAVGPNAQVRRHGWGSRIDAVVEILEGPEAITNWAQGANRHSLFVVESLQAEDDGVHFRARYRVEILNFLNRGWWRFSLDELGRIHVLWHRADALLDPAMRVATVPEEQSGTKG
jgi:hypothetical protein